MEEIEEQFGEFSILEEVPKKTKTNYTKEMISYASNPVFAENAHITRKIKEMQEIARRYQYAAANPYDFFWNRSYIFYQQALFMKDFEDHFERKIDVDSYQYFYDYLSIPQLRTYFTWRTKVRNQVIEKTETAYVIIYLAELANQVGVEDPVAGWNRLIDFWKRYCLFVTEDRLIDQVFHFFKDYWINYALEIPFEMIFPYFNEDYIRHFLDGYRYLEEIQNRQYDLLLPYIYASSSYKILNSKFYGTDGFVYVEKVLPIVFQELETYFSKKQLHFRKEVFGSFKKTNLWEPFSFFPYYEQRKGYTSVVLFQGVEQYTYKDQVWSAKLFTPARFGSKILGVILKAVELKVRERTRYKRKLSLDVEKFLGTIYQPAKVVAEVLEPEFLEIIYRTIDQFFDSNENSIRREIDQKKVLKVEIDPAHFEQIRAAASRVQERLIIEEDQEDEVHIEEIPEQSSEVEMGYGAFLKSLTSEESQLLQRIVEHTARRLLEITLAEQHLLFEVVLEAINTKALDYLGDNLVEDDGVEVYVYDDYIEELKQEMEMKK